MSVSDLKLVSKEDTSKVFFINAENTMCVFRTSLGMTIDMNCSKLSIRNQSGENIDDLVTELLNMKMIQNTSLRSYNGINFNNNGTNYIYKQVLETRKLNLINNSAIFTNNNGDYQYLRKINDDYYLIVLVETGENIAINGQVIQNNSWYIINYTQNPNSISSNTNHFELIDTTSIIFLSENTKRIGSQKYPDHPNIEYF